MPPRSSKRLASWPKLALLINRNYTLLWLGGTISLIGDILFTMMLILWVGTLLQNQSAAPLAVSGVVLAAALPALLIGSFAGVFVDRWPKQRTMRIMEAYDNDSSNLGPFMLLIHLLLFKPLKYCLDLKAV